MFKKDFSQTQWEMNQKQGSQCKECCKTRAENAHAEFAKVKAAAKQVPDPAASPTWPSEDQDVCPTLVDRSPASSFAFQEPQVLPGHARNQGCAKMDHQASPTSQESLQNASMRLLTTAHEELSHTGGRDAIVTALTEEGKKWNNMAVDAQWVVNRCEATTTEVGKNSKKCSHLSLPKL